jgi:hypothetical protein
MIFKDWRMDRFVRLFSGIALAGTAFFFSGNRFYGLLAVGAVLIFTAVNGRCPFNACAVKAPVKKEEPVNGKVG